MTRKDMEDSVRRLGWPAPEASLRDRVLSQTVIEARTIPWSDRVWYSRTWRVSMATAALALVALSHVVGMPRVVEPEPVDAGMQAIEEAGLQLGLSPSFIAALASRERATRRESAGVVLSDLLLEAEGGGE